MHTQMITCDGVTLYSQCGGAEGLDAPTLVFANSLGTNLHLWDEILPHLDPRYRIIRWDLRGHGRSDVPSGPYTMGALVSDAAAICDAWHVKSAVYIGLSVGGMIAQGLAVKRPDLIRGMVLSNTAAKIGNKQLWQSRIDTLRRDGMALMAETVMQRWFSKTFCASPQVRPWKEMLSATPLDGYIGVCQAIAGTDFYTPTSGLRIPTLGIAGSDDHATPVDLVRETVDLIPGSQFEIMRRCGHLPCVENPEQYAKILSDFLHNIGHLEANAL